MSIDINKSVKITKITNDIINQVDDLVVNEYSLKVIINGQNFAVLQCTPKSIENLVTGFLFSEGIINSKKDIEDLDVDIENAFCEITLRNKDKFFMGADSAMAQKVVTTACGRNHTINYMVVDLLGTSDDIIKPSKNYHYSYLLSLINKFNKMSETFSKTGGVHSCALADQEKIILFEEDIGRHNALDKIVGYSVLNDISLDDKILLTSGRLSSEMVTKVIKGKFGYLLSRSAPTDKAIELSKKFNLNLIGFARGNRMNIYNNITIST